MSYTVSSLEKILQAGGNLTISEKGYTVPSIEKLAKIAASKKLLLTIKNVSSFTVPSLEKIASAGDGYVVIDFSE